MKLIHRSGLITVGLIVGAALGALATSFTISVFDAESLIPSEVMKNVNPIDAFRGSQLNADQGAHACADDELSGLPTRQGEIVFLRRGLPMTTGRPSRC